MIRGIITFGKILIDWGHSYPRYKIPKVSAVGFSNQTGDTNPSKVMATVTVPQGQGKLFTAISEVVSDIPDGAKILVGGFGACGVPVNLIQAILTKGCKNLTIVANNPGTKGQFIGKLIAARRIRKMIVSYIAENPECQEQYGNGELELELTPQGNLVERIRAGGAGIPAFYTPTGYGTILQEGKVVVKYDKAGNAEVLSTPKSVQEFDGRNYVLEKAITGDFALIRAWKADKSGNLIFRRSARNFNPAMCKAAKITIVEAEEIVETGQLDPDHIHIPGIFVDRVVQAHRPRSLSEQVVLLSNGPPSPSKDRIIRRAVLELKDGMYVNLGVGLPLRALDFIPENVNVTVHSENGVLGVGISPPMDQIDPDITNAAKNPVTILPGASMMSSEESFVLIRGGHLDVTMLGAIQVSQKGDLANWLIPGSITLGMGGAMDLVTASRTKVIVTMFHNLPDGTPKILKNCTIPLTGQHCVDMIITDLAVFEVDKEKGLSLIEIAPDVDIEEIVKSTGCEFAVSKDLKVMRQIPIGDEN